MLDDVHNSSCYLPVLSHGRLCYTSNLLYQTTFCIIYMYMVFTQAHPYAIMCHMEPTNCNVIIAQRLSARQLILLRILFCVCMYHRENTHQRWQKWTAVFFWKTENICSKRQTREKTGSANTPPTLCYRFAGLIIINVDRKVIVRTTVFTCAHRTDCRLPDTRAVAQNLNLRQPYWAKGRLGCQLHLEEPLVPEIKANCLVCTLRVTISNYQWCSSLVFYCWGNSSNHVVVWSLKQKRTLVVQSDKYTSIWGMIMLTSADSRLVSRP